MSVEVLNCSGTIMVGDKSIIVQDAYKRYSDIISMKGLNMSVSTGTMYVFRKCSLLKNIVKLILN